MPDSELILETESSAYEVDLDNFEFESHGLVLRGEGVDNNSVFIAEGERFNLSDQKIRIHFHPFGKNEYGERPLSRLFEAYLGFKDFEKFLTENDGIKIKDDTIIYGYTNYRMAQVARRLGFKISDDETIKPETLSLDHNNMLDEERTTIFGRWGELKSKISAIEKMKIGGRGGVRSISLLEYLQKKSSSHSPVE